MIEVMQAYDNGELCQIYVDGVWNDMNTGGCLFNWSYYDYRIKPKVTETERKIKVMQAYADGRPIETTVKHANPAWIPCINEPEWDWYSYDYRVKKI